MKILKRIKAIIRKWKSDQFLKLHRCKTYEEYNHRYDPLFNPKATYVKNYYHGYNHIWYTTNYSHHVYQFDTDGFHFDDYGQKEMYQWCKKYCKGKFRVDTLNITDNMNINFLGNTYIFFAFTFDKDYTKFLLRWT